VGNTIITISFLIIFGGIIMTLSLALGIGLSNVVGDLIKDRLGIKTDKKKGVAYLFLQPVATHAGALEECLSSPPPKLSKPSLRAH